MSTLQDYSADYTETDAVTRVTVAAQLLTIAALDDDESVAVCSKDGTYAASFFSADYEHTLYFNIAAGSTGDVYVWGLSDTKDTAIGTQIGNDTDLHALMWDATGPKLTLTERNSSSSTTDNSSTLVLGTTYYVRITRDEDTGTYGTLFCHIYTDEYYMTLIDTLSVTLTEKKDFRYLYGMAGVGSGSGGVTLTGTINNLARDEYAYTMENMRTRVRDLVKEASASFFADAEINRWLNDGERLVAVDGLCLQHIDSISTTSSTRTVSFSGHNCEYLEAASQGLRKILPTHFGQKAANSTNPESWYQSGSNVCIEPLPSGTVAMNAYIADYPSVEMSNNPDIPEAPPTFRPLIVLYALSCALEKDKKFSQALQVRSMFNLELRFQRQELVDFIEESEEYVKWPQKPIRIL